ncbi:MAG: hypothetical protein LBP35_03630 [Candidatus Ancillula trichonymphae]|nr:hypothetical protein [Candidatus Ancillula trichonymphae]
MDEKIRNSYNELLKSLDTDYNSLAPARPVSQPAGQNPPNAMQNTPQNINQMNQFLPQFLRVQFGGQSGGLGTQPNSQFPIQPGQPNPQFSASTPRASASNVQQPDMTQTQSLGQPLGRKAPQFNSVPAPNMPASVPEPALAGTRPQAATFANAGQPQARSSLNLPVNPHPQVAAASQQFANAGQAISQLNRQMNAFKQSQNSATLARQFPSERETTPQQPQSPRPQNHSSKSSKIRGGSFRLRAVSPRMYKFPHKLQLLNPLPACKMMRFCVKLLSSSVCFWCSRRLYRWFYYSCSHSLLRVRISGLSANPVLSSVFKNLSFRIFLAVLRTHPQVQHKIGLPSTSVEV